MINGIDMLLVAIALGLILVVWTVWDHYTNWSEWDRDRRRERKHYRYELNEIMAEAEYRIYLRRLLKPGLISSMNAFTRSLERFNSALRGESSE